MSDVVIIFLIGGELAFLAYAVDCFSKELKRWKSK